MRIATIADRATVVNIIVAMFKHNHTIQFMVKNDNKTNKRITAIAEYAFDFAVARDGVYISDNNKGVAICYQYNLKSITLKDIGLMIKMVFKAIHISKLFQIFLHDNFIKSQRPVDGNYYYFWFFGVLAEEQPKISARDLTIALFEKAKRIYLTRVEAEQEADTYFPPIHPDQWHLVNQQNFEADEKNAFNYSFQT